MRLIYHCSIIDFADVDTGHPEKKLTKFFYLMITVQLSLNNRDDDIP